MSICVINKFSKNHILTVKSAQTQLNNSNTKTKINSIFQSSHVEAAP